MLEKLPAHNEPEVLFYSEPYIQITEIGFETLSR